MISRKFQQKKIHNLALPDGCGGLIWTVIRAREEVIYTDQGEKMSDGEREKVKRSSRLGKERERDSFLILNTVVGSLPHGCLPATTYVCRI